MTLQVLWSTSRRTRNRRVHALNGNGPSERGGSGRAGARPPRLLARDLQKAQLAKALRDDGWELPAHIKPDAAVLAYDTRLDVSWLKDLYRDIRGAGALTIPEKVVVVGGDFVTRPAIEDSVALAPDRLKRWGPEGPCHIVVPPRPHVRKWVDRLQLQVGMEDAGTAFTLLSVVDRDLCPGVIDKAAAVRLLPQATAILEDESLEVQVVAVGERAPVLRVPADVRRLPPLTWETGLLPRNRVLVALTFHRVDAPAPMTGKWIRGSLPDPEPSGLELLRVEYELPPATRERSGVKEAERALRRAAGAVGLAMADAHRLQLVKVEHGGVRAVLGVPRAEAKQWLRASGCGGVFLRPFWTKDTSAELERHRFNLLWLRGQREVAPRLWDAIHDVGGVWGLLAADGDVAIRVCGGADRAQLEAQVKLVLGNKKAALHQADPGLRWWRLGPLEDADVFQVGSLIAKTGLTDHGNVRLANAGPFRRVAYFTARGEPTRLSLDDGGWGRGCSARLSEAGPPPPPRSPRASATRSAARAGPALAAGSTWGGQRSTGAPTSVAGVKLASQGSVGEVAGAAAKVARTAGFAKTTGVGSGGERGSLPSSVQRRRGWDTGRPGGPSGSPAMDGGATSSLGEVLRGIQSELAAVRRQLEAALEENAELRRQLQAWREGHAAAAQAATATLAEAAAIPPATVTPPASPGAVAEAKAGEMDETMRAEVVGSRYRDSTEVSPGKPRKKGARSALEGAVRHDL